ncbi:tRNA(Ile)-lysidine synthetase [Pneumocystis carinii B80]|uniref:tRNA(Ile)-lysidine synthetase n=1 Tax=Pneumocystis carinii (strain B80) TaxID=1408658 RepID=A0A0W4ZE53_PNEC8|nr:tRNA(Ile)-lysidine synthetase [Pneumocystis carinii B80]KTW26647.1 tRNA(Ile)-lysidine synthetase [Pneumocystis carinii B80]
MKLSVDLLLKPFQHLIKTIIDLFFDLLGFAVSGGCDSMALCLLFQNMADRVYTFTVDHQLRPKSREEAEEVHKKMIQMGFQHKILTIDWKKDKYLKGSLEALLRDQRYTVLTQECLNHDIGVLFLGHHLNDQVETVLMRLIRKSGSSGLACMQKISLNPMIGRVKDSEKILICRPFLDIPKIALKSACEKYGLIFFEDPTNTLVNISKRNAIRVLLQKPEQLPKALRPDSMLHLARVMSLKRMEIAEKVKQLLTRTHITFSEMTGSLNTTCDMNIYDENIATLSKWLEHLVFIVSPLPRQRISVVRRIVVDLFEKKLVKTKQYTVGGVLIHTTHHSQTLFMQLSRQPYAKSMKEHFVVFLQSSSLSNPQNTWILWDGRWWIRILSRNNEIIQFKVRPLMESDMKQLYSMIYTANSCNRKIMLDSLKTIKECVRFAVPLVETKTKIIGLPTLGIIFDYTFIIETKFKIDMSTQLNCIR